LLHSYSVKSCIPLSIPEVNNAVKLSHIFTFSDRLQSHVIQRLFLEVVRVDPILDIGDQARHEVPACIGISEGLLNRRRVFRRGRHVFCLLGHLGEEDLPLSHKVLGREIYDVWQVLGVILTLLGPHLIV